MKILLVEFWGLGDVVMMSTILGPLLDAGASITVLCKPTSAALLRPSYPQLQFLLFDAPWTVFHGKYRLWKWPWKKLLQTLAACWSGKFDAVASVRSDPRDHLWMFLCRVPHRMGFPRKVTRVLLTRELPVHSIKDHRVDQWRQIGAALLENPGLIRTCGETTPAEVMATALPYLNSAAYPQHAASREALKSPSANGWRPPIVALHCGARIAVRRWDEKSFEQTIRLLRQEFDFHLALFPDIDGYGRSLIPLADSCHENLSLSEMVADLAVCDVLLCNDSGPAHIATGLGRPVLAIFGPTNPDWFRPYGEQNHVVIRDICPYRPCFDYCRFPQPICLTQLVPDDVWPEIRAWFQQHLEPSQTRLPLNPSS